MHYTSFKIFAYQNIKKNNLMSPYLKFLISKQSGTHDLDGLDTRILKLATPLIPDTLIIICLQLMHNEKHFSQCFWKNEGHSSVQIWWQCKLFKL